MSKSITQDMAYQQSLMKCAEKIRRQPRKPKIQQEPVIHLLLETTPGRKRGVPGLSVQASS